jgi:hypothetical protein
MVNILVRLLPNFWQGTCNSQSWMPFMFNTLRHQMLVFFENLWIEALREAMRKFKT